MATEADNCGNRKTQVGSSNSPKDDGSLCGSESTSLRPSALQAQKDRRRDREEEKALKEHSIQAFRNPKPPVSLASLLASP